MPIEEKPNEIRARVRDPNDFAEIFGYTDIDKAGGIRAIYGRLKSGGNAIQAYRFDTNAGWTLDKAKKWLSDHNITLLSSGELQLGEAYLAFEAKLLKELQAPFVKVVLSGEVEEDRGHVRVVLRAREAFREMGGFIYPDKAGVRAAVGLTLDQEAGPGQLAVHAFEFNKAFGWSPARAKTWLRTQGADIGRLGLKFKDDWASSEAQLLRGLKAPDLALVKRAGVAGGPPLRLLDLAAGVQKTLQGNDRGGGGLALVGSIVEDNATVGPVTAVFWGGFDPARARELLGEFGQRFRLVKSAGPPAGPHIVLAQARADYPALLVQPGAAAPARSRSFILLHAGGPTDLEGKLPALVARFPEGEQVLIEVGARQVQVLREDGTTVQDLPEAAEGRLLKAFGSRSLLHGWLSWNSPEGRLLRLDDILEDAGTDMANEAPAARWARLQACLGRFKSLSPVRLLEMEAAPDREAFERLAGSGPVLVRPVAEDALGALGSTILSQGPLVQARVYAVKRDTDLKDRNYSYLLGVDLNGQVVPLGVTGPTKGEAKVGDEVLVSCERADAHIDPEAEALWFNLADCRLLLTGVPATYDVAQEVHDLLWAGGENEPMAFPHVFYDLARTGTMGREWEAHLAAQATRATHEEALSERVVSDRSGAPAPAGELPTYPPNGRGAYVAHVHKGVPGRFPDHTDLRFDFGKGVLAFAILNGGKPCGCPPAEGRPLVCCPAELKSPQSTFWLGEGPERMSDYELLERGTFEAGIQGDVCREFFLTAKGPFGQEEKRHVLLLKLSDSWKLMTSPLRPWLLNPLFQDAQAPLPPAGVPAIPAEMAAQVPTELRWWLGQADGQRRTALTAFRQLQRQRDEELARTTEVLVNTREMITLGPEELKASNFTLAVQTWQGPAGAARRTVLTMDFPEGSVSFGAEGQLEKLAKTALKLLPATLAPGFSGDILGSDPMAPAPNQASRVEVLEAGKVIVIPKGDNEVELEFRGHQLRGRYTLLKTPEGPTFERKGDILLSDKELVPMKVRCVSLAEGVWKGKYYPKETLQKAKLVPLGTDSFCKVRADHSKAAADVLGRVDRVWYEPSHATRAGPLPVLMADYTIQDPFLAKANLDGDVTGVSWGMDQDVDLRTNPPTVTAAYLHELSECIEPACAVCHIEGCMPPGGRDIISIGEDGPGAPGKN